jgi:hypothetical protein
MSIQRAIIGAGPSVMIHLIVIRKCGLLRHAAARRFVAELDKLLEASLLEAPSTRSATADGRLEFLIRAVTAIES